MAEVEHLLKLNNKKLKHEAYREDAAPLTGKWEVK